MKGIINMDLIGLISIILTAIGVYIAYKAYKQSTKPKPVFKSEKSSNPSPKKFQKLLNPERLQTYLKWLQENYSSMDTEKLQGKGQAIPLSLPEIFIPLYANDPKNKQNQDIKGKNKEMLEQREKPVDIERLIDKTEYLVIKGQAGSGKTTLLKHFTYFLAKDIEKNINNINEVKDYIPVIILLKDLNEFFSDNQKGKNSIKAEDILSWYFKEKIGNIIDFEMIFYFINEKKVIFMLDGLDEIKKEDRKKIVDAFADLKIGKNSIKIVLSGRPHGIDEAVLNRFRKYHVKILELSMEQVNLFVTQWFNYLYKGISAGKNSDAMIADIKTHPGVSKLIDNPLMLTAICILYYDEKKLPEQRAELYKKFIANMLFRRDLDKDGTVYYYLKKLAFKMHKKRIRATDKKFAVDILKNFYKKQKKETDIEYKDRLNNKFNNIEMRCGLLKLENGEYFFCHLTFQEFLTADYIADISTNHKKAIEPYWDDDWYKEVIELYVGYLSIEHRGIANNIVMAGFDVDDKIPYKRWIRASHSLVDIQKNTRYDDVVEKARERLGRIIDNAEEPRILAEAGELLGWLGDERDLKDFVKIEGGEYDLGEELGVNFVKPFEIDRYPVTNMWYKKFVESGGYKNKKYWTKEGQKWLDYTKIVQPRFWDERKWNCPNLPVVGVCWYEADAFARWLTLKRNHSFVYKLPSEIQWQAAAAGKEQREYPWGNEWDENKCNNEKAGIEKTSSVGIFKSGNTPEGVSDLSGNVWEWTASDYHLKKEAEDFKFDKNIQELIDKADWDNYVEKLRKTKNDVPVIRGGSWFLNAQFCRVAGRGDDCPEFRNGFIGFRLVLVPQSVCSSSQLCL
jgi:formylglycine-generating enzyme required for sulfatase activity/archaellum biogenesis ATPase FlaH